MKKLLAILLSVTMLLAFASCGGEKETVSSEVQSEVSSDVPSDVSSDVSSEPVDPNAPLTDSEIESIMAAGEAMEGTNDVDFSADVDMTVDMFGTAISTSMKLGMVRKGQEVYQETVSSSYGIEQKEIVYFKDGKYYSISSFDGETDGYYEEMTYEEAFADEESSVNTTFVLDEVTLAEAKIERAEDGSIKVTYDGDNEDFINAMKESFAESLTGDEYDMELTDVKYTIVFDKDFSVTSMVIDFKIFMSMEEEGMELSMSYDIVMDITFNAYGENADITVPVPEDLDSYDKLDWDEEF